MNYIFLLPFVLFKGNFDNLTDRKLKLNIDYDIIKIANLGFCAKSQDTMRYEFMDLRDVEMSLGIQFPELFHAINSSGMMDPLKPLQGMGRR